MKDTLILALDRAIADLDRALALFAPLDDEEAADSEKLDERSRR